MAYCLIHQNYCQQGVNQSFSQCWHPASPCHLLIDRQTLQSCPAELHHVLSDCLGTYLVTMNLCFLDVLSRTSPCEIFQNFTNFAFTLGASKVSYCHSLNCWRSQYSNDWAGSDFYD